MSALSASKSGARSARGPKRIDLSGYGTVLSALITRCSDMSLLSTKGLSEAIASRFEVGGHCY